MPRRVVSSMNSINICSMMREVSDLSQKSREGGLLKVVVLVLDFSIALDFFETFSFFIFLKILFSFGERGREEERNIGAKDVDWLPLVSPQLGTCLITQTCALTGS